MSQGENEAKSLAQSNNLSAASLSSSSLIIHLYQARTLRSLSETFAVSALREVSRAHGKLPHTPTAAQYGLFMGDSISSNRTEHCNTHIYANVRVSQR